MTTSTDIERVKESSLETKQLIDELVALVTEHESSTKSLSDPLTLKGSHEIRERLETIKAQIRKEIKLTKRVESLLKKQQTIIERNRRSNDSIENDEIRHLSAAALDQSSSIRELRARLRGVETSVNLRRRFLSSRREKI
jgi:hypothetical protein